MGTALGVLDAIRETNEIHTTIQRDLENAVSRERGRKQKGLFMEALNTDPHPQVFVRVYLRQYVQQIEEAAFRREKREVGMEMGRGREI